MGVIHMDSYIVRVYRRSRGPSGDEVAGLIEEVGSNQKTSFQTISGLVTTLRQMLVKVEPVEEVCELYPEAPADVIVKNQRVSH
jgi:hypothetical protein